MLKKIIIFLMVLTLCLSLGGCVSHVEDTTNFYAQLADAKQSVISNVLNFMSTSQYRSIRDLGNSYFDDGEFRDLGIQLAKTNYDIATGFAFAATQAESQAKYQFISDVMQLTKYARDVSRTGEDIIYVYIDIIAGDSYRY